MANDRVVIVMVLSSCATSDWFSRSALCRWMLLSARLLVSSVIVCTVVLSLLFAITQDASAQRFNRGAAGGSNASKARDDATICIELTQLAERTRRFPKGLLYAIARVESGRQARVNSAPAPWPWTVTVGGEGRYYNSKEEAVKAVEQLQRDGRSNIDVGCMQVNLHHHGRAFGSVSEAIDPVNNVAYATEYLVVLYKRYNNWEEAIKYYHSSDPNKHNHYLARVKRVWEASRAPRAATRRRVVKSNEAQKTEVPILSGDEAFQLERESLLLSDDLRKKLGITARTENRRDENSTDSDGVIASSAQNSNASFFLKLIDEPL